jgi:hypothetical protein
VKLSRRLFLNHAVAFGLAAPAARVSWTTAGQKAPGAPERAFSASDRRTLHAVIVRMIPPDETPGAGADVFQRVEAEVAATPRLKQVYAEGLAALSAESRRRFGQDFPALSPERQDELLEAVAATPFLGAVRGATVRAFYNSPTGWKSVGFPGHSQPMGYGDFESPPSKDAAMHREASHLPADEGRSDIAARCSQCHDTKVVVARRRSAAAWRTQVERMKSQYHVVLSPDETRRIIRYLSRNFGVE